MEFLGIGYLEVLVVLALILVVVGPRRLPEMAYYIGRFIKKLQGYARVVRDEFGEEFAYLNEEMEAMRADVREVRGSMQEVREELKQVRGEVEEAGEEAREAAAPVGEELRGLKELKPSSPAASENGAAPADAANAEPEPPRGVPGPAHMPPIATIEARDAFAPDGDDGGGETVAEPEGESGTEAASGKPLVF